MNEEAELVTRLTTAIKQAWEEGCPVAAGSITECEQEALAALRRWNGFMRRNRNGNTKQRVEDLAKGLRDAYEP